MTNRAVAPDVDGAGMDGRRAVVAVLAVLGRSDESVGDAWPGAEPTAADVVAIQSGMSGGRLAVHALGGTELVKVPIFTTRSRLHGAC